MNPPRQNHGGHQQAQGSAHEHQGGDGHSETQGEAEQLAEKRKPPRSGHANMASRQLEYARALRAPFIAIRAEIRRGIVERGIFDSVLGEDGQTERLGPGFDPDDLTPAEFRFTDSAAAHSRFMAWLRDQQAQGVLDVIGEDDNLYVRRALSDGDRWAIARLREQGVSVDSDALPPEAYRTSSRAGRAAFVRGTFDQPIDAGAVRLLFQRNYNLLEGITEDTSSQIGRVLSEGFAQGNGPLDIARDIGDRIDSVGQNRATLLARHEVMYAHNQSALNRIERQGVGEVRVLSTDPCPQCQPYTGNVYPVRDVPDGGPPWHPNCLCTVAPVV